jgi:serine/threonine-protein kinase RsbW
MRMPTGQTPAVALKSRSRHCPDDNGVAVDDHHPETKRPIRARLIVRAQDTTTRDLEDFVDGFAAAHGLTRDDAYRTVIVLEELLTNLWKYGYPDRDRPEGYAEITLELQDDRLTIEFADDGQAFDPLSGPPPDLDQTLDLREPGRLGLHITREFMDEARYDRRDGRNVVRLSRRVASIKRQDP